MTVSDPSKPERSGVAVTVWLVSVPTAFALQISDVPAWVLLRLTSVHVSPAPVTVALCAAAALGPSKATKASTASPAVGVVSAGDASVPLACLTTSRSIPSVAGGGALLSTVTADARRRAGVAGRVGGLGGHRVRSGAGRARVPRGLERRRGDRGADRLAVDLELHARDADVVGRRGAERDDPADRRRGLRVGDGDLRRRPVGRRGRLRAGQHLDGGEVPLVRWSAPCRRWPRPCRRPGVGEVCDCAQKVSPLPVSSHWWRIVWPAPSVRPVAPSQSLPAPNTHEPGGRRGQRHARRARRRRRPRSTRRRRRRPAKATRSATGHSPARDGVEVTVVAAAEAGAVAFQISEVPGARVRAAHERPGQAAARDGRRLADSGRRRTRRPAAGRRSAWRRGPVVVTVPRPSTLLVASMLEQARHRRRRRVGDVERHRTWWCSSGPARRSCARRPSARRRPRSSSSSSARTGSRRPSRRRCRRRGTGRRRRPRRWCSPTAVTLPDTRAPSAGAPHEIGRRRGVGMQDLAGRHRAPGDRSPSRRSRCWPRWPRRSRCWGRDIARNQ